MSATPIRSRKKEPIVATMVHHHEQSDTLAPENTLDRHEIASLSPTNISQMARGELADVVRAHNLALLGKDISEHLDFYDRETLERMVYLVRRCCRNLGY